MKKLARVPVRHRKDDPYWDTPAFYRPDGTPVYPVGGAAPDDDDDDDAADDADDADDDDLDAEIDAVIGDDADDADDDADLTPAEQKLLKRMQKSNAEALAKIGQSVADRTVNAVLKATKAGAKPAPAKKAAATDKVDAPAAPDYGPDIREARASYREYVGEEVKFNTNVEREAGLKLANAIVTEAVQSGTDPDAAGKQAAQVVGQTLKAITKSARRNLLMQLQKEGRLLAKPGDNTAGAAGGAGVGGGTQPTRIATGPGASTDMQKGAAAAARLLPGRVKTKTP